MKVITIAIIVIALLLISCTQDKITGSVTIDTTKQAAGSTFKDTGNEICAEDGKPIIRLFATSWCPHCLWVKPTFMKVASEYAADGKIVAYLWEMDKNDNLLTDKKETSVPKSEQDIFAKFNEKGSVPTFVFGCKYLRIGNAYETERNLAAEESEFRAVIDKLLQESKT